MAHRSGFVGRKREQSPNRNRPNMGDLRIVLLGKNVSENNQVKNVILGKDVYESAPHTYKQKHNVLKVSTKVNDRQVTLINTRHLLSPYTSDQITQTVRECVETSAPGPHAFILVLQYENFTKDDVKRVQYVLNQFSEDAIKHTIIITTTDKEIDRPMESNSPISEFINACGGRHLQLEEKNPEWPAEILNIVDMMLKDTPENNLTCEVYEDVKESSLQEEQNRSLDSSRSEEENKHLSHQNDDGKPKLSMRSEGTSIVRECIRTNLPANISGKQKLNLVLCGSDKSLKVSVSELLLGVKINNSHQSASSGECVKKEEKIHGRQISLVELPALSGLSEDEVMRQTLCCVSLCDPGVHAFLLIIPVGPLTDGDKLEIERIWIKFGSKQHFITIFVSDGTVEGPVAAFIQSSSECQKLISRCGGLYRVMGLKEHENSRQIPELLDYIEKMKTEPYSLQMYVKAQETRARRETEEKYEEQLKRMGKQVKELLEKGLSEDVAHDDLRIVLLGKTGEGKSASGNTILRRPAFKSIMTPRSVTRECQKYQAEFSRRRITVIDTPGLFDTGVNNVETRKEIAKCVSMAAPGPHVFLLVIQLGRVTKEVKDAVKMIQEMFGDQSRMYTIVLFTKGDQLKEGKIEVFIEYDDSLKMIVHQCEDRYHVFNNETEDETQVYELLDKIDCMLAENGGTFYTNEMFQRVEMNIREEQNRIMKEKEEEVKRKEEELRDKYETEIEQMKNKNEKERKEMQGELRNSKEEFKKKEEMIKKEKDESLQKELQRKLEEQQKQFEEENKRKEKALGEQQDKFQKFLEEQHKKDKQELKERIQQETREQAEQEYREKYERKLAKALKEAEEKYEIEKEKALQDAEEKYNTEKERILQDANKKQKTEVDKALQNAKDRHKEEVNKVLRDAEKKQQTEVDKALQNAEDRHKEEVNKVLQDAEKKQKAEVDKALQNAEERHNAEVKKFLQDVEKKHNTEVEKAFTIAEERHMAEVNEVLQDAEKKLKTELDKALQIAEEGHKAEVNKIVEDAEKKIKEKEDETFKKAEQQLPYRAKRARDWGDRVPVVGAAAGAAVGAFKDLLKK